MVADLPILVRNIEQIDAHTLGIEWTDGRKSRYNLATLRRRCPCATCIDEWTGKPLLDPKGVPDELTARTLQSVGRYALTITFADGHSSGIFSFSYLRKLDDEEAPAE